MAAASTIRKAVAGAVLHSPIVVEVAAATTILKDHPPRILTVVAADTTIHSAAADGRPDSAAVRTTELPRARDGKKSEMAFFALCRNSRDSDVWDADDCLMFGRSSSFGVFSRFAGCVERI